MKNKIKDCPFCGGEFAILQYIVNERRQKGYYVQCSDCLSQGPIIGSSFGELNDEQMIKLAINKWNRRA